MSSSSSQSFSGSSTRLPQSTGASNNGTVPSTTLPPMTQSPTFSPPTSTFTPPNNNNGGLATSASLYLYTFLATLVLLLSVSGAIVVRSFVLRRRHRRMIEEAIRNGTWVPPAPPTRPARVDLSKKPKMWEAFIDGGKGGRDMAEGQGQMYTPGVVGAGKGVAGGRLDINPDWQHEHAHDWDTIKPFSATYVVPGQDEGTADAPGRVGSSPSTTSVNRITPTTPVSATPPVPREPLRRALLSSARRILSPTPAPTSPLPGPSVGAGNGTAGGEADAAGNAGHVMAELNSRAGKVPTAVRVAVLVAMPRPPGAAANDSHADDEEQPLPHIEVGVAEVLVVSHELSESGKEGASSEKPGVRGSVASRESDLSEV